MYICETKLSWVGLKHVHGIGEWFVPPSPGAQIAEEIMQLESGSFVCWLAG